MILRRDELGLDGLSDVECGRRLGEAIRAELGENPHIVFDYVGRKTFATSVWLKRVIGSHAANWQEAWGANRLVSLGRLSPALSRVFNLEDAGDATRTVQRNEHLGTVGVLCLAERAGLGVEDAALRERIGEDRIALLRESV